MLDVSLSIPFSMSVMESDYTVEICATLSSAEATERDIKISLVSKDGTGV